LYSPLQLARKYFNYYLKASNAKGHGVHSPFVFEFIKFVKNDRKHYADYSEIELIRKKLLSDNSAIEVEDFGAGSTLLKSKKRPINRIAASSLKPKRFAQLLYRVAKYYQPKKIIELGTSFGITTSYLAKAAPHGIITSFEGSPSIASIAKDNFKKLSISNISVVEGDFGQTLSPFLSNYGEADLIFIDGNHRRDATIDYFNQFLGHTHEYTIMIFDDIHWSEGMEEAWEQIIGHEKVTLSIDLFYIGIVFFRKEFKVKQHFSIRF